MDKNPFLKYVMKDKTKNVIHSSAYANAQNADRMGTTDSMSFSRRMAIEGNRKIVRSYRIQKLSTKRPRESRRRCNILLLRISF